MNLLAISGSLREASSNTAILRAMASFAPPHFHFQIWYGLGNLPAFSPDQDFDASPESVTEYRQLLKQSDGVIICTPEYAFGMPGVLKNALDWAVSSGEFDKKPLCTISASPSPLGGEKAHESLSLTLKALGTQQPEDLKLCIPAIKGKLNVAGEVDDPELLEKLQNLLNAFIHFIEQQPAPEV